MAKAGSTKLRRIHHLSWTRRSSINGAIAAWHSRYESVDDAVATVRRVGRGALLAKIDVKAAFRTIPVHPSARALLGFWWDGSFYADAALPFGLKSSPPIWECFGRAYCWTATARLGIPDLHRYVDDLLAVGPPGKPSVLSARIRLLIDLAEWLGIPIALDKLLSEGSPSTRAVYLGVLIDTVAGTLSLPTAKLHALRIDIAAWRKRAVATVRDIQRLVGRLAFVCRIVVAGRPFLRRLISLISDTDAHSTRALRFVRLSTDFHADLQWWHHFLGDWSGSSYMLNALWQPPCGVECFTDASELGSGVVWGQHWFSLPHPPEIVAIAADTDGGGRSMPVLEAFAILAAATAFGARWSGQRVTLHCDCQPVVAALAADRLSSRSRPLMRVVRAILAIAARHSFALRVVHIAGTANVLADALSRGRLDLFRAGAGGLEQNTLPAASSAAPISARAILHWLQ